MIVTIRLTSDSARLGGSQPSQYFWFNVLQPPWEAEDRNPDKRAAAQREFESYSQGLIAKKEEALRRKFPDLLARKVREALFHAAGRAASAFKTRTPRNAELRFKVLDLRYGSLDIVMAAFGLEKHAELAGVACRWRLASSRPVCHPP